MDPTLKAVLASWQWRPDVALVVAGLAAVYVAGWCRLRRRKPKAVRPWRLALYLCGLAAIILALLSPLDTFAPWLFTLHMVEHQLLTMVAPPLLLLANPLPVVLWGLPRNPRHALGRLLARGALVRRGFRRLTRMPVTWVLYMVILWSWHLPGPYQAALQDDVLQTPDQDAVLPVPHRTAEPMDPMYPLLISVQARLESVDALLDARHS